MFGPDPIDLFDPSPYGALSYYGHILIGIVALVAALAAFAVRKGGSVHRKAGLVFIATVAVVCLTTAAMLATNFIPPLFMAMFTAIYAIGGAYLALQAPSLAVRVAEVALTLLEIIGLAIFLTVALDAVADGRTAAFGPAVIATIPLILLAGDANWFAKQGRRAQLRIARHLSRMIWAFVVVLRAPLVEVVAGGLPVPVPVVIFGPILLALGMLWYFQRRYGGSPFGRSISAARLPT